MPDMTCDHEQGMYQKGDVISCMACGDVLPVCSCGLLAHLHKDHEPFYLTQSPGESRQAFDARVREAHKKALWLWRVKP